MLSDVGEPGREGALGHPEQRESDIVMRNGPESKVEPAIKGLPR